jgi:hypothetical protein
LKKHILSQYTTDATSNSYATVFWSFMITCYLSIWLYRKPCLSMCFVCTVCNLSRV